MTSPETLGQYLKRQRELRHISLHEVGEITKINPIWLRAFEGDEWEKFPAPVIMKGFLSNYAKVIGINPDEVLLRFEEERRGPVLAKGKEPSFPPAKRANLRWLGVALLTLVVIAALWFASRL